MLRQARVCLLMQSLRLAKEHPESREAASNDGPDLDTCHARLLHDHQPRRASAASVSLSA